MKLKGFEVLILIALLFYISGCTSEEETPFPDQKASVKKPIVKPVPAKNTASEKVPDSDDSSEKDEVMETEVAVEEATEETPEPEVIEEEEKKEIEGIYIAEKDDTLSVIAGKEDIMGDSLKWPLLYRLNMNLLTGMEEGVYLPDRPIPEGTQLHFVTEEVLKNNLKTIPENLWVINILSSATKEKINPVAIKLLKEGYYVYISKANVKGQEWVRLRVGFFQSKNVTDIKGKRIKDILNIRDIWTAKVEKDEFQEYGGYYLQSE